jgi:sulfate permease, SulP family
VVGRGSLSRARFSNLSLLIAYRWTWLRADMLAGLTVAAYLVPQVIACARLVGEDPDDFGAPA